MRWIGFWWMVDCSQWMICSLSFDQVLGSRIYGNTLTSTSTELRSLGDGTCTPQCRMVLLADWLPTEHCFIMKLSNHEILWFRSGIVWWVLTVVNLEAVGWWGWVSEFAPSPLPKKIMQWARYFEQFIQRVLFHAGRISAFGIPTMDHRDWPQENSTREVLFFLPLRVPRLSSSCSAADLVAAAEIPEERAEYL